VQAIGVINADESVRRVLVVCPASLKINWLRELKKWLVRPLEVGIADSKCFPSTDIVVINYDIAQKYERSLAAGWDLMIVDEAHYLKNPKALRTRFILGHRARRPADSKSGIPARRKIFLTGTPICNRPVELWPILHALDAVAWPNFFKYAERYCGARQQWTGRGYAWDFRGASNLTELQGLPCSPPAGYSSPGPKSH